MIANAKEWHPPAIVSTSTAYSNNNDAKDDKANHINHNSKSTANHKSRRRRRQHQRTSHHRYGKKHVNGNCLSEGKVSYTSNNSGINEKEVYHADNSTNTSNADDIISSSIQDVHYQFTTQNHISKHQEHQKHKQRRRRRRYGDKKKEVTAVASSKSNIDGDGSHHTHKVANHRRRYHKKKVNGSATSEKHPDDGLRFDNNESNFITLNTTNTNALSIPVNLRFDNNESNFPTLNTTNTNALSIPVNNGDDTNWNDSLANKLASIEIEEQKQKYLLEQLQLEEDMKGSVQLTKLTYNKPLHNILDEENIDGDDQLDDRTETDEKRVQYPPSSSTEASTHNSSSNYYQSTLPNTKHKWTNTELTKMRKRWWDAVRAKRRKVEEERLERRRRMLDEKETGKALLNSGDVSSKVQHADTDDSSSDDNGSNSSSSFSSSDNDSLIHTNSYDPMEPPSLSSTPFDEMTKPNKHPRPQTPPIIPYIKPTVSQSILDLEKLCLGLDYPLHYAVYIISLKYTNQVIMGNSSFSHNNSDMDEREKSDGEIVLNRLLTMQNDEDVDRWRTLRVGLSTILGLEDEESTAPESDLLSADVNALTPLQLAIYLNLPGIVRFLYTTSTTTSTSFSSKNNSCDEEDEHGRTPLMLACELNRVECIQTIMCISSPRKLVRREQLGGNTAYHFCCMSRSNYKQEGEDDSHDHHHQLAMPDSSSSQCANAFDMLLRYTPIKEQKRILSTTNYNKQNLLHLACNQGDLQLLEILLDCHTTPGVNVSKALDIKDKFGYTPFVSAVASES